MTGLSRHVRMLLENQLATAAPLHSRQERFIVEKVILGGTINTDR